MNHDYRDITSRISDPPLWWDEHAVPRYCDFSPDQVANIYASEAVLLLIACQACGTEFRVAFSGSKLNTYNAWYQGVSKDDEETIESLLKESTLEASVLAKTIHYGDPPNNHCCASGPTMNSIPVRVIEFWERHKGEVGERDGIKNVVLDPADYMAWKRRHDLEIEVTPDWASD